MFQDHSKEESFSMAHDDLIAAYLIWLQERGCTDATIDSYRSYLLLADKRLPLGLDVANETEIRVYLWRKGLKASTRRGYRSVLTGFFRWATEMGELDFNPMARIPSMKVPRGLPRTATDHHVQWLLTEAEEPFRLWGLLAAYAGTRSIEVSRLHREHVTEQAVTIHRGKGDKPRSVPTHPIVWQVVQALPPGAVTEQSANDVSKGFWKYCVRSKKPGLSMHRLRGWWCSNGYDVTKDIVAMQRGMGHNDPRTTAGYIKLLGDAVKLAVDGLPTFGWAGEGRPQLSLPVPAAEWRNPFG